MAKQKLSSREKDSSSDYKGKIPPRFSDKLSKREGKNHRMTDKRNKKKRR
jgi:hypothetical protein